VQELSTVPKTTRGTTYDYNITAEIISGTMRLSGDIVNDTIEVPRGDNGRVTIADTTDWYLYASTNSAGGVAGCWGRSAVGGALETFSNVQADAYAIVYAVAKTGPGTVAYGPVITIKPKG
jgi:hypothetical protein